MQAPTSDHLWALAEHLANAFVWMLAAYHWIKRRAESRLRKVVTEAVKEAIQPVSAKVDEMYPVYEAIKGYVKPNGKAVNGGLN